MNLNKAQLIGNLVADPETRSLPSGQTVTSFQLATNYTWRDAKTKKRQRSVEYHSVIAWGKISEVVSRYLNKGDRVYVDGRLHTRSWTGRDGIKRSRTEIVAQNMIMLGSAKKLSEAKTEKVNDEVITEEIDIDKMPVNDKE